jgi:quercetin dioxygenase-like cupin family protein
MQHWDLLAVDAPAGTRDPHVVHQDESARAVLIALTPGQELGDHQVKENAWIVVVDGRVQVRAGAEQVELAPGGLMRFEPGERHALASSDGARILMLLAPWPGAGHFHPEEPQPAA